VDTKAVAALCLGVLAAATGWALGGAVPATIALVLAREASREIAEGQGWRVGTRCVTWARRFAWIGLGLATVSLVLLVLLRWWQPGAPPRDFPSTVD